MEDTYIEYHCPECGILAGKAHTCVLPTFYCCGKRFPSREMLSAEQVAYDSELSLEKKERILRGYVKQFRNQRRKLDIKFATKLHVAERHLKDIMRKRDGIAVLNSPSKHAITIANMDRRTEIKAWHTVLGFHAAANGLHAPKRPAYDECLKYARDNKMQLPPWVKQ